MTMTTRREVMALISGALASTTLGGRAFAEGPPKKGGTLRISAPANPSSLDPATGGAGSDHAFLFTMYDTLTEWEFDTLKPKPGLAESWKFTDPTTLVLNIRAGITFHDGTPLDAEAVRFNLERNRSDAKSNIKADLLSVAAVEVTGPQQVTLKLKTPDTALPGILSDRAGMMVSPTALKAAEGGIVTRKPVGAGAYSFVSWADGEKIVVKRNEKYWKPERPLPDAIEISIIPELTTGARSVTAGQNDLIYQLPPRQKVIIERASSVKVVHGPTLYVLQIFLNWAKPPFDNLKVRQALNFAIDRESFVKAALAGLAEPAYMNLPKAHWAYDAEVAKLYPYDPDRARKLLAEAGFKEGTPIELGGYPDQDSVQRQEILIEQLRKAGIGVRFVNAPIAEASAAFFGAEKKGAGLLSAWTGRPDPSLTYSLMFTKDAYYNAGRAPVPGELEAAIKESRASEDIEVRRKAFSTVQRLVMENAFVVPLAFQFELVAMNKKVQGYRPNLLGKPKYDDVWLGS
ncbi:ABC-type transport system substrate-binding protein [Bradyrhizobium japonicum]|uniref:ABC transporter substrate-binding protein n=1 Tax=Bradyrhizobium TaxID=374 RepID=UPI00036758AB|nr:ABC transporter substrate-binding protein [Bradyrhizobium elkanii]MCP1729478.1 peptide/nickel transport system permease protein/peptide/nickel transport system substrate-binding protein [Bradyrhizobium elkanii]MCS3573607.1 peptide/nickel transport system permease protein/peptide/nickel transport system substrate-binding protein [Bradyrhizobium elkanii]MCS3593702.1 peptide/nickel transport system permease protein/peptide/nickel transport system substrate-binding protein [Bradyrhizobium elkanii